MLGQEPTREELLDRLSKLETSLRWVEKWAFASATDLTEAGYGVWSELLPRQINTHLPEAELEIPQERRRRGSSRARVDPMPEDVNVELRAAIGGGAAIVQVLGTSFDPRRGEAGWRRDVRHAVRAVELVYGHLQNAQVLLDGTMAAAEPAASGEGASLADAPRPSDTDPDIPADLPRCLGPFAMDAEVNLRIRAALDGSAALVQVLATAFHPRRGIEHWRRDLRTAMRIVERVFENLREAQALLDGTFDHEAEQAKRDRFFAYLEALVARGQPSVASCAPGPGSAVAETVRREPRRRKAR